MLGVVSYANKMAVRRKGWRQAACMILAVGPYRYLNRQLLRPVAETGSLPVCMTVEKEKADGAEHCELLFVKRNSKTKFMPNTHVFPGGVLDKADHSSRWLDLFKDAITPDPFSSFSTTKWQARLPMYQRLPGSVIPGEVAFRICAIRELFEESGVLLARRRKDVSLVANLMPGSFQPAVKWLPSDTLNHWRARIHGDAFQFMEFCKEFECVPDIWSLVEWSNWLTPRNYHRRYDTVFYLCCPAQKPPISPDIDEVTKAEWLSPSKVLQEHADSHLALSPPQFLEITFINSLGPLPSLHAFGLSQSLEKMVGLRSRNSVRILTNDFCVLSISEEDDLYPLECLQSTHDFDDFPPGIKHHCQAAVLKDTVTLITSDQTLYEYDCPSHSAKELRDISVNTSRMEWTSPKFNDTQFHSSLVESVIAEHMDKYRLYCSELKHSPLSKL